MNILKINSSAKITGSRSRELTKTLSEKLQSISSGNIIDRDLTKNLQFLNEEMIDRFYTPEELLDANDKKILSPSDNLTNELINSDVIVIGAPMYNFGISGMLKSYLDQVCRLGKTFSTNPQGFEGLLKGKIAYIIITTGGTPLGGEDDFMTDYLKKVLSFIGVTDIRFFTVDKFDPEQAKDAMQKVNKEIDALALPL